jgi:carbamoyl-phosphate synthase large subunit
VPLLPMKILVTGAGALLGQGIVKAIRQSTLDARIATADPNPLSAGLFWADEAYLIAMADAPDYLDRLGKVLATAQPDIVIPGTDVELPIMAAHRERIEEQFGTRVLVSDPRVVAIADDKYLTFEFLNDGGFAPPASALPEDNEALNRLIDAVGFPLVVKPRIGARSIGVGVVSTRHELNEAVGDRRGLVVQECVGGDDEEYTASVIVFDGEPQASIVMRRDLRDGNTYRAFCGSYPDLNRQVKELGATLRPYGPANFQFRLDSEGRARVFEINGRFSGTTPLRALVGFNEVEMCIRHILYDEPIVEAEARESTILRYWSETVVEPAEIEALR